MIYGWRERKSDGENIRPPALRAADGFAHPSVNDQLTMRMLESSNRRILTWIRQRIFSVSCGLVCLTAMVLVNGCSESPTLPTGSELRVALNPWPGYSFMYLAEEKGYFREEGLSVRLVEMASLADARRVFEHGQSDLICCTLVEVLMMNEFASTNDVQCIAAFDYSNGADMLLARSGIASLESLRGGRIGLEPESVDCLAVYLALKSVGLTLSDVKIVPLAQSEMFEALNEGKVDAVQAYPPASDAISRIAGVHTLWDTSHAPGVVLDVLAGHQSVLEKQPHAVRGLLRAYQRAYEFYQKHPQEALAILTRRCKLDEEAMLRFLGGMKTLAIDTPEARKTFNQEGSREVTECVAKGLVAAGMLQAIPIRPPFDYRFAESLVP